MASATLGTAFRHLRDLFNAGSVVGLEDGQLLARYSGSGDPAAFEALVDRHGPMVLATCRAVLRNEHDAEDAFQATFLVLSRKARSIRGGEALGGWLHRVAYRASVRASVEARLRRRKEAEASALTMAPQDESHPAHEATRELRSILHEEIDRLPEGHRLPVVLCDLEGLTYEQAAEQLRWTLPTLRCRLAKARQRLKGRLDRLGAAPLVAPKSATAIVPPALLKATVLAASGGPTSVSVAILTHTLLKGMLMTKIKIAGTAALSAVALAGAGVIASGAGQADGPRPDSTPVSVAKKPNEPILAGEIVQVLDPDGKPAVGAKVYRSKARSRNIDHETRTAMFLAGTDGNGSFRISTADLKADAEKQQIVVMVDGCGPAFVDPAAKEVAKVIRLARDDLPIRGRVLDLQGKPIAGASVQVVSLLWHPSGRLDAWIAALDSEKVAYPVQYRVLRWWMSDDIPSLYPAVATDRDGRFTIRGVGRERVASLLISGPGIETRFEFATTREMKAVAYPDFDRQNQSKTVTYHGASFDLIAGPGIEVVGSVRDQDTGKPLAGVTVQTAAAFGNPLRFLRTTTDPDGNYKLQGLAPKTDFGDGQDVLASIQEGPPYLSTIQPVGDGRGTITRDFAMKRGAWATGRITDKTTGKPVQASLGYYILEENPHLKDYPRYATIRAGSPFLADEDGRYKIVVMPGRGVIGARLGNDTYRLGMGVEKIPGLKLNGGMIATRPHILVPTNYNTIVGIDPKEGEESVLADVELDRGKTLKGSLVGPGGEPLPGAWIMGAEDLFQSWSYDPLPSSEFEVHGLGSEAERFLIFWHKEKGLAGSYSVKAGEDGPIQVKLEPCGSLTGRLVDDEGLPRAGVQMTCNRPNREPDLKFEHASLPDPIKTDAAGRFRLTGLVPGLKYSLAAWKGRTRTGEPVQGVIIGAGEARDLGDVKVPDSKKQED